jgi:hypothetical protein
MVGDVKDDYPLGLLVGRRLRSGESSAVRKLL